VKADKQTGGGSIREEGVPRVKPGNLGLPDENCRATLKRRPGHAIDLGHLKSSWGLAFFLSNDPFALTVQRGSGIVRTALQVYQGAMARPLRIEFPDAVYHVTSRGDRQEPIFVDDRDRAALLGVVARALARYDTQALAYCLMGNHYHFVLHTRRANLSLVMRHINGMYTQVFNRRHGKTGHLFQGRFNAILVDRDSYLLEVCRYVELNPVRARLVSTVENWP
jgi:REP element-mobilizing transposase RayT